MVEPEPVGARAAQPPAGDLSIAAQARTVSVASTSSQSAVVKRERRPPTAEREKRAKHVETQQPAAMLGAIEVAARCKGMMAELSDYWKVRGLPMSELEGWTAQYVPCPKFKGGPAITPGLRFVSPTGQLYKSSKGVANMVQWHRERSGSVATDEFAATAEANGIASLSKLGARVYRVERLLDERPAVCHKRGVRRE